MVLPQFEVTLSKEDQQNASSVLFEPENEGEKSKAIHEIQEWISANPDLKGRNDEKIVTRFLRSCKYRPEHTRAKLTNHFQLRARDDSWFKNRDPKDPTVLELLKTGTVLPLRGHDKEGRTVILVRTAAYNPSKNSFLDVFKVAHMIMDLLMELDETISVYGVQAILDLSGNTFAHVLQLTPNVVGKAMHAWQNCYPVRTRRIDFVNAPVFANVFIKIFLKFMNDKLKNRVHVFGLNQADLHNIVDPTLLPEEYGGSAGTIQELIDYWMNRLIEYRDWFIAEEEGSRSNKNKEEE